MEDRFKFRAWDISDNCYVKITQLNFDTNGSLSEMKFIKSKSIDPDGFEYVCYQDQLDKFIFEQCTGCSDCSNQLIYEGDILEIAEDMDTSHVAVRRNDEFQKWTVEGDTEADYEFYDLVKRPCDTNETIDDVGVVGNIHENPELLENQ